MDPLLDLRGLLLLQSGRDYGGLHVRQKKQYPRRLWMSNREGRADVHVRPVGSIVGHHSVSLA